MTEEHHGPHLVALKIKPKAGAQKALDEMKEDWAEAEKLRRHEADWAFILSKPPRITQALIEYVRTADLLRCAKMAGVSPVEFDRIRERANIMSHL